MIGRNTAGFNVARPSKEGLVMDARNLRRVELLKDVRAYTKLHPELSSAHHFLFDLPFDRSTDEVDFFVMGVNPGETKEDLLLTSVPTEETRECDFQAGRRSKSSTKWYNRAKEFVPSNKFIFTEMFFWSSPNQAMLTKRFGKLKVGNSHFDFCAAMNKELIALYKPKMILCVGIGLLPLSIDTFGLKQLGGSFPDDKGKRLIVDCIDDDGTPWIFTKHWSGARVSKREKGRIVEHIQGRLRRNS